MRIGLDAMGGDHAPREIVRGALAARDALGADDVIVLVGHEKAIREHLGKECGCPQIVIQHAEQAIGMGEPPVEALRGKPNSSIVILTKMHRRGELDACISAGNTGAYVAAAQVGLRRLKGVDRPGIAVLAPTFHGPVAMCDCGANVNCRPHHLHQYAVMTSVYMKAVCNVDSPRVGLLSVGQEEGKGNSLVKKASALMRNDSSINFVGNVEGHDLLRNVMDVMVCEGFVGNVVLKLVEGLGVGVVKMLASQLQQIMPDHTNEIRQVVGKIHDLYDFNQYGGAPLLGVDGIWIVCHGASQDYSVRNAVREAIQFSRRRVNELITQQLNVK
jgi:glycerol-3-phosphate acyltransferase PlsX